MVTFIKKGGAGTLGYNDMTAVTNILETLLEKLRTQELTLTKEMSSALLEAGDVIAAQSAKHREGGKVDANAVSAICAKLERFLNATDPREFETNSGSTSKGNNADAAVQADNLDYGFFGQQPQVKPTTREQEEQDKQEDYGFFKQ